MLLREIVRALRHEVNLVVFCQQLMVETRNKESLIKDFEPKDRLIVSIADILTLSMFISISPAVREAVNAYHRGDDKRDLTPFKNFLKQVIQCFVFFCFFCFFFHFGISRYVNKCLVPQAQHYTYKVLISPRADCHNTKPRSLVVPRSRPPHLQSQQLSLRQDPPQGSVQWPSRGVLQYRWLAWRGGQARLLQSNC